MEIIHWVMGIPLLGQMDETIPSGRLSENHVDNGHFCSARDGFGEEIFEPNSDESLNSSMQVAPKNYEMPMDAWMK